MVTTSLGSLTKEFPLSQIDRTILAIRPGVTLNQLRQFAEANTHVAIPALLAHRFLLVGTNGRVVYDRFLSLVASEGISSPRLRKIMYFVWALRDPRIGRFIIEVVADENGKWRARELTKKVNEKFFRQFFEPRTAPKVRSNFEYFLVEAGILDPQGEAVHLELEDGWLVDGMQIAAQHERNAARRRAMTSAPADFLLAESLHGLANATSDELHGYAGLALTEPEPLEDLELPAIRARRAVGRSWDRPKPSVSTRTASHLLIDSVARERASAAHWTLEKLTRDAAVAVGYDPKQNQQIDMYFLTQAGPVLAEMKSCVRGNLHGQVRRGVGQLFEYRYLFRDMIDGKDLTLLLVIEMPPVRDQMWLVAYLESIGIMLAWKDPDTEKIVSASPIPAALSKIVLPAS